MRMPQCVVISWVESTTGSHVWILIGISFRGARTGIFPGHDRNNNQRSARRRHAGSDEGRIRYPVGHSK